MIMDKTASGIKDKIGFFTIRSFSLYNVSKKDPHHKGK